MNGRGRVWVRVCLIGTLASLAGCSWLHHGEAKCRDPGRLTGLENGAGLKIPPGLDHPDTRGAVRVPELSEPEPPQGRKDPCLSTPPSYKTGQP